MKKLCPKITIKNKIDVDGSKITEYKIYWLGWTASGGCERNNKRELIIRLNRTFNKILRLYNKN